MIHLLSPLADGQVRVHLVGVDSSPGGLLGLGEHELHPARVLVVLARERGLGGAVQVRVLVVLLVSGGNRK